ncbi:hypothetical protein SAMN05428995_105215 [Loktanella sp. DSM 29012]|nr:hypothetical protein SAMN05428995_105215 [Loktanella sp. DSM 29012]
MLGLPSYFTGKIGSYTIDDEAQSPQTSLVHQTTLSKKFASHLTQVQEFAEALKVQEPNANHVKWDLSYKVGRTRPTSVEEEKQIRR